MNIYVLVRFCLFVFIFGLFLYANNTKPNFDVVYYQKKALKLGLHKNEHFKELIWANNLLNSKEVNENSFYFSLKKYGIFSVKNELLASIEAFYAKNNVRCKYKARFNFLNNHLHFKHLPKISCDDEINSFGIRGFTPTKLFVTYASRELSQTYLMMGHIFLKIEGFDKNNIKKSFVISFFTPFDENILLLGYRAIFGGAKGIFSPYPSSLIENDYLYNQGRYLSFYEINFSQEEMYNLLDVFNELNGLNVGYRFIDKNCGSVVYKLLRLTSNNEQLTYSNVSKTPKFWATPLEHIKHLKKINLLKPNTKTYIPSRYNQMLNDGIDTKQDKIFSKLKLENSKTNSKATWQSSFDINKRIDKIGLLVSGNFINEQYGEIFDKASLKLGYLQLQKTTFFNTDKQLYTQTNEQLDEEIKISRVILLGIDNLAYISKDKKYYSYKFTVSKDDYYFSDLNLEHLWGLDFGFGKSFRLGSNTYVYLRANMQYRYKDVRVFYDYFNKEQNKTKKLEYKNKNIFDIGFDIGFISNFYNIRMLFNINYNKDIGYQTNNYHKSVYDVNFSLSREFGKYVNISLFVKKTFLASEINANSNTNNYQTTKNYNDNNNKIGFGLIYSF